MGGRDLRSPFLSVYGHITTDQIISVDEFPANNTSVNVTSNDIYIGGTGTNIAVIASSLGVPTALCGFVGTDFPKRFTELIESKGVITDEFIVQDRYSTALALIVNDSKKEQRAFFYPGPQGSATKLNNILKKNAGMSKYVHFSTGEPDYYLDIMSSLRDGNAIIVFDPAQEIHWIWNKEKFKKALGLTDILFCNRCEAETARKYADADSLSKVFEKMFVCTKGAEGSELYRNGTMTKIPVVESERTVDNTGAGDAYRAGFYAGKYNKYSDADSLVIGAATASFTVEKVGALSHIPSWDMVMERADRYLGKF